jgi:hypothetical protein
MNRYSELKVVVKGFAQDFRFTGDIFIYRKPLLWKRLGTEVEVDISSIINWKEIGS